MSSGWDLTLRGPPSVSVEDEPWEGAVFVAVASVSFAPVKLNENLITCIQMKDDTVAGVVVTLVLVLGDGAGPDLEEYAHTRQGKKKKKKTRLMSPVMHTSFCVFCGGNLRADLKHVLEYLNIFSWLSREGRVRFAAPLRKDSSSHPPLPIFYSCSAPLATATKRSRLPKYKWWLRVLQVALRLHPDCLANVYRFGSPGLASCINSARLCCFFVFNLWAALSEIVQDIFNAWLVLLKIPNL